MRFKQKYSSAVKLYLKALELLPQPIEQWDIAGTTFGAIGEVFFIQKEFEKYVENDLSRLYPHFYCEFMVQVIKYTLQLRSKSRTK